MFVFRLHLRPHGTEIATMEETFEYCINNSFLGVGWRLNEVKSTQDWDEYYREAALIHDDLRQVSYIKKWVSQGDLVWTRDTFGQYFIARVTSPWEYYTTIDSTRRDIDIGNIFRCDIKKVPYDEVPGKLKNYFIPGRVMMEVGDKTVCEYSKLLWNKLVDERVYEINRAQLPDLYSMLDPEETEDLVLLYLQTQGFFFVRSTRQKNTMMFEYLMINPKTLQRALVQVRTGDTAIDLDNYVDMDETIFVFQSNAVYDGEGDKNVIQITRDNLNNFLLENSRWLPKLYELKLKLAEWRTDPDAAIAGSAPPGTGAIETGAHEG